MQMNPLITKTWFFITTYYTVHTIILSHYHYAAATISCSILIIPLHSKLRSITPVAAKMHVTLRSFVVLTWMRDTSELV